MCLPVPTPAPAFHALRPWCVLINACCVQEKCVCMCFSLSRAPDWAAEVFVRWSWQRGTAEGTRLLPQPLKTPPETLCLGNGG